MVTDLNIILVQNNYIYNQNKYIVTLAITANQMASWKLSATEVLALLHPHDEDIFDDLQEPVQDGNDEEFDESEDDFSDLGRDDSGPDTDVDDEEEIVEDSFQDRTELSGSCEVLQDFQPGTSEQYTMKNFIKTYNPTGETNISSAAPNSLSPTATINPIHT